MYRSDDIRRDQLEDGRRMARSEFPQRSKSTPAGKPREKRKEIKHHKHLANLSESREKTIVIIFVNGASCIGYLRDWDEYTLYVRTETDHGSRDVTIYKSAIMYFYPRDVGAAKDSKESTSSEPSIH
ncbi:hypothetical protein ACODYM_29370 [Burkholderia gladioli]|uniref:hypothetical protein n=1 Tax=Burkholderia gladioli TaxID=28095 RepID=UPI003B5009E7